MPDNEVNVIVGAANKTKKVFDKVSSDLGKMSKNVNKMSKTSANGFEKMAKKATESQAKIQKSFGSKFTGRFQKSFASIKKNGMSAFGAIGTAVSVGALLNYGDGIQEINNKLISTTGSQEGANIAFDKLAGIADRSRTSISSLVPTFQRFNNINQGLGISSEKTFEMVETLSKGLQVAGASTAEASSAVLQLSQAYASGRLQGDEFRALTESFPAFTQKMADSLGVPIGKLKELSSEGKITREIMSKTLENMKDDVDEKIGKMPVTISQAFTGLGNTMTEAFTNIQKKTKIFDKISIGIAKMGDVIANVSNFLIEHESAMAIVAGTIGGLLIPALGALAVSAWAAVAPFLIMAAPFIAVGAAIGGVIYAGVQLVKNWDAIKAFSSTFFSEMGVDVKWWADLFMRLVGGVKEAWGAMTGFLGESFSQAWDFITKSFQFHTNLLIKGLNSLIEAYNTTIGAITNTAIESISEIGTKTEKMTKNSGGVLNSFKKAGSKAFKAFEEKAVKATEKIEDKVKELPTAGKKAGEGMVTALGGSMKKIGKEAEKMENKILKAMEATKKITTRVEGIYEKTTKKIQKLGSVHVKEMGKIKETIADLQAEIDAFSIGGKERESLEEDIAEKVVEAQESILESEEKIERLRKDLKKEKEEESRNSIRDEIKEEQAKINEQEKMLNDNSDFISEIDEDIQRAKKLNEADEISRMRILFEEKKAEVTKSNKKEIELLKKQVETKQAIFEEDKKRELNLLRGITMAHVNQRMLIEGKTFKSMSKIRKATKDNLTKINEIIGTSAQSSELDEYIKRMNDIIETNKGVVASALAVAKVTGGKAGTPTIPNLAKVPKLATGGIVTRPTTAIIGEGGEPEAIIPLSKSKQMGFGGGGTNLTININGGNFTADDFVDVVAQKIQEHINLGTYA